MKRRVRLPLLVIVATVATTAGCLDVREFEGVWSGPRIGESEALRAGFAEQATAELAISGIDLDGFNGRLTTSDGVFADATVIPLPAAEADVLGSIDFASSPARVYLAFVEPSDAAGPATVFVALYNDDRIEVRALRGGPTPLYGIFSLEQ